MTAEHIELLLIEYDPGDSRLIQELLAGSKRARFSLTRVASLGEALAKLESASFDAALLALALPDSRGLVTFQTLHAAAPALPVVIMTGIDAEDEGVLAVKHGAQDYIIKGEPASDTLVRTVRRAIARPAVRPSADRPALTRGGETILIVDDEAFLRRLMSRILTKLGYCVREAPDGAAGLELVERDRQGAIRLVLTDRFMPKMSGEDLAQRVAAARPDLPVLFVSGNPDDTFDGIRTIDDKTDILAKPFTAEELAARVRRALDHGR